jgi:foldase protein PrsA
MPVKKTTTKKVKSTKVTKSPEVLSPSLATTTTTTKSTSKPIFSPKVLASVLILVGVGLVTYKAGPWLVPAIVDKTPITRIQLANKLDQAYGAQVLDDMINEQVLKVAIKKSGVKVDEAKVDEEIKNIESQFESLGGLDEALTARGMSRDELVEQIKTQLAVEEILKDKLVATDEEVEAYYQENKETLYKDMELSAVTEEIRANLRQSKLSQEFMTWFTEVKESVSVKNFTLK